MAEDEFPNLPKIDGYDPLGTELAEAALANLIGTRSPKPRKPQRRTSEETNWSGPHPDERDPQLLGNAIGVLIEQRRWRKDLSIHRMMETWELVVGAANAAHSKPEGYADKVLRVRADSTAWATVLRRMAPQIVARLNKEIGQGTVERIDIKGPDAPSWRHGRLSIADGRGPRDTYG